MEKGNGWEKRERKKKGECGREVRRRENKIGEGQGETHYSQKAPVFV